MKLLLRAGLLAGLCASAFANPAFDEWAEAFTQQWIRADPIAATQTQYLPAAEQEVLDAQLNARLGDGTPLDRQEVAQRVSLARRGLDELKHFPRETLTSMQQVSADLLTWRFADAVRRLEFADQRYVFDQMQGLQIGLVNFLTQTHPIRHPRDVQNYLARLQRVGPIIDAGIAEAHRRAEAGVLPPRFILDAVLGGVDRFLAAPPDRNVFVTSLDERIAKVPSYPAEERQAALSAARQTVSTAIRPAFLRLKELLVAQRTVATDDAGVWRLPRGEELYAAALASNTTIPYGPDDIHGIGLREVMRLEREMHVLLLSMGQHDGRVNNRYYNVQCLQLPASQPDPRPQLLDDVVHIVRDAEKRAEVLFDLRPRAPIEVRREPAMTEENAAAHYSPPAPDGSRPGIYWVPLANISPDVIWLGAGTRSVAYHEAVPGHHFQIALQQESTELPRFRKLRAYGPLPAYTEGWALYAERLVDEAGWYQRDDIGRLGYLNLQLLRARRLVVDTGLHARRWGRERGMDYGIQASEVERYVVMPGQACAYIIGQLRILELRERAQAKLGAKFSLKEFHNVLLRAGELPLDVLDRMIDRWIAGQG